MKVVSKENNQKFHKHPRFQDRVGRALLIKAPSFRAIPRATTKREHKASPLAVGAASTSSLSTWMTTATWKVRVESRISLRKYSSRKSDMINDLLNKYVLIYKEKKKY